MALLLCFLVISNTMAYETLIRPTSIRATTALFSSRPASQWATQDATTSLDTAVLLTAKDLFCQYNPDLPPQLSNVNFQIQATSKIGLVGRNGCGKSTLMNLLHNPPLNSGVEVSSKVSVAFVEQDKMYTDSELTVDDALFSELKGSRASVMAVQSYIKAMSTVDDIDNDGLTKSMEMMDEHDGWNILQRADELKSKMHIDELLSSKKLIDLSGGERKRVSIVAALMTDPDFILMDEPTNHLDIDAIEWLSNALRGTKVSFMVITHDRGFLESTCNQIWELDNGEIYPYGFSNYQRFLEAKEERLKLQEQEYKTNMKTLSKEQEWVRRQPQGRQTKSKVREASFYSLKERTKRREVRKIEIGEGVEKRRLGGNILKLNDVSLERFGKTMLKDFSYDFNKGDRIGIVGPNGVGKSTFLQLIMGIIEPSSGTINLGETIKFGYYAQEGLRIEDFGESGSTNVLNFVKATVENAGGGGDGDSTNAARQLLQKYDFPAKRWMTMLSMLSGGELRRIQLLLMLAKNPNVILLDEPSNDLDLDTIQELENFLIDKYDGVLVIISHDKYFLDEVCNGLFVFEGDGKVSEFLGTFSDYVEEKKSAGRSGIGSRSGGGSGGEKKKKSKSVATTPVNKNEKKTSGIAIDKEKQKAQRKSEKLEASMEKLEEEIAKLIAYMAEQSDEGASYSVLVDTQKEVDLKVEKKEQIEEEYLGLLEKLMV